jgi:basic membrane lipoprotein Med (substrate-binding protein (PBP1-ABC) superfamily)
MPAAALDGKYDWWSAMPAAKAAAERLVTAGAEVLVVVASPTGLAESETTDAGGASMQ